MILNEYNINLNDSITNIFANEFFFFISEFFFIFYIFFIFIILILVIDTTIFNLNKNMLKKPDFIIIAIDLTLIFFVILIWLAVQNFFNLDFNTFSLNHIFFNNEFNNFLKIIVFICSFFCLLMSRSYFKHEKLRDYEFLLLFLLSVLGTIFLIQAQDFICFYISIELQSLSFYILATLKKNKNFSIEAGLKYFILGAISSCILLLGLSLLYGFSGTCNFIDLFIFIQGIYSFSYTFDEYELMHLMKNTEFSSILIENYVQKLVLSDFTNNLIPRYNLNLYQSELMKQINRTNFLSTSAPIDLHNQLLVLTFFYQKKAHSFFLVLGFILIFISFFFKLGLFPLHLWVPDVYEGVPLIITAIFSILPKFVLFTVLLKFSIEYIFFLNFDIFFNNLILFLALMSILIGSFGAIYQNSIKRFIAYSAIGHIGYLFLTIYLNNFESFFSFFFYFLVYILLLINFFLLLLNLRKFNNNLKFKNISDLKNIYEINPIFALILALNIFSMAGIPPLLGFFSKYFLLISLIDSSSYLTALFVVLVSVLSSFYYIRIIKNLFFVNTFQLVSIKQINKLEGIFICLTGFINIFFILKPFFLINLCELLTLMFLNNLNLAY